LQIPSTSFVGGEELSDGVIELTAELPGEDDSGTEVISVAEPAGNAQDLEFGQSGGVFEQSVEVQAFRLSPGQFESPGGFDVAVGAGCAENADFGGSHEICRRKSETGLLRVVAELGNGCIRTGWFFVVVPQEAPDSGRALPGWHSRLERQLAILQNTVFGSGRKRRSRQRRLSQWPAADLGGLTEC